MTKIIEKIAQDYRDQKLSRRGFLRSVVGAGVATSTAYGLLKLMEAPEANAQELLQIETNQPITGGLSPTAPFGEEGPTSSVWESTNSWGNGSNSPFSATTNAVGEEDGDAFGNLGSFGGSTTATTLAIGEEDTFVTPTIPSFEFGGSEGTFGSSWDSTSGFWSRFGTND